MILSSIALLFNRRFYLYDDTQAYIWGIWYRTGQRLIEGDWSFLNPHTWQSGNMWAEGQWGLLNPFLMLVSVGANASADLGVYTSLIKILFLAFSSVGGYLLACALGADQRLAILAGALLPLNGFTVYMDSASWFSGTLTWGWCIWLWLALVRLNRREWGLLPAAGFLYLIVTVGYVHGTIIAGLLVGSFMVGSLIRGDLRGVGSFLMLGIFAVAVAAPVYLPGILTAPVTQRSGWGVTNSGAFGPDLSDLALATTLTGGFDLANFAGPLSSAPLMYIAWALPLMWWGWSKRDLHRPDLIPAFVFLTLVGLFLLGPTEIGPLRWPVRVQPYVALAVILIAVSGSAGLRWRSQTTSRAILTLAALPLLGGWLVLGDSPANWKTDMVGLGLVLAALASSWFVLRRPAIPLAAVVFLIAASACTVLFQRFVAPAPALPDWGLPTTTSDLQSQLVGAKGDTYVLGTRDALNPGMFVESSLANAWLVNPTEVQNGYGVIGFRSYAELLGVDYLGLNSPTALKVLLSDAAGTDQTYSDLFGIQNLQIWRSSYPQLDLAAPPSGWQVADEGVETVVWSRIADTAPVGDIGYVSPGLSATTVQMAPDSTTIEVTNETDDPGVIVLKRLAWPGYSIEGPGRLVAPSSGIFVTVEIPPHIAPAGVVVRFEPPGLRPALAGLVVMTLGLAAADVWRRRRKSIQLIASGVSAR